MLFHMLQPPSSASSGTSTIRRARTPPRERAVVEERVGIGAQKPPLNHAVAAVAARRETAVRPSVYADNRPGIWRKGEAAGQPGRQGRSGKKLAAASGTPARARGRRAAPPASTIVQAVGSAIRAEMTAWLSLWPPRT